MDTTSQLVKRVDGRIRASSSQVDIDGGAVDGAVTEAGSQGEEVEAVLIAVCGIGMAQGVGTEAAVHTKSLFMFQKDLLEPLLIHGSANIGLLRKEPGPGFHMAGTGMPITPDILTDTFRDGDIAV